MLNIAREKLADKWLGIKIHKIIALMELIVMGLYKDKKTVNLIRKIVKEDKNCLPHSSELFMVYSLALRQMKRKGDFAEVGVFNGTSAKMICEGKGNKNLYLFDTFGGLPKSDEIDKHYIKNMFIGNYEYVKKRLSQYENVHIVKGLFPKTAKVIKDKKFAFVHLDVDLYQSTKDCLEFFYDRMEKGGIILSHDYPIAKGVKKAFDDFFSDKEVIELPMSQCMVIK